MKSFFIFLILFSVTSLTTEAQLVNNKKATYRETDCYIERINADVDQGYGSFENFVC